MLSAQSAQALAPIFHFQDFFMRALFLVALLCLWATAAKACDVCGCASGGNYIGVLPQFQRNFLGLRWSGQQFRSAHSSLDAENGRYDSREQFQTLDLIGRFYPTRRLQMLVMAPYHNHRRHEGGRLTESRGLGDLSLLGNYVLRLRSVSWQQMLTLGAGIKLPTGASSLRDGDGRRLPPNLQPGTGNWSFAGELLGRLNTTNSNGYRLGHRLNTALRCFYWKSTRRSTLLPNVGLLADWAQQDSDRRQAVAESGGRALMGTAGVDVFGKRLAVGASLQWPLAQQLAEGRISPGPRFQVGASWLFGGDRPAQVQMPAVSPFPEAAGLKTR
jgi:hypothetical protein